MQNFKDGDVVYHKATHFRCVIIRTNSDGTIKVRDEKNNEQDYFPQELQPQENSADKADNSNHVEPFFKYDMVF
jgi:hypothetical protein